jgi:hypothetical protein
MAFGTPDKNVNGQESAKRAPSAVAQSLHQAAKALAFQ